MSTTPRRPAFLAALFDATFSHLLGLRLVRALYLLALLVTGTYGFFLLFIGIGQGGMVALLAVFVVPTLALLVICLVRLVLEALVVVLRMGEQTERLSKTVYTLSTHLRSQAGPGGSGDT